MRTFLIFYDADAENLLGSKNWLLLKYAGLESVFHGVSASSVFVLHG